MLALQVARIIAEVLVFIRFADAETLNPAAGAKTWAEIAHVMRGFEKDFARELIAAFDVAAADYEGDAQSFVRDIPRATGLDTATATGG